MTLVGCSPVVAQTALEPNEFLEAQWIFNRSDSMYEPNEYQIFLDSGEWTVVIETTPESLEIKVTVARDIKFSEVVAVSGDEFGNFPIVGFTLNSSARIYILVEENSVNGSTYGVFNIGVFDQEHIPHETSTSGVPVVHTLAFSVIIIVVGLSIVFGFAIFVFRFVRDEPTPIIEHSSTIRPAAPQLHDTAMISLPKYCPNCGQNLVLDQLEWVGPLSARCDSCGATIHANL